MTTVVALDRINIPKGIANLKKTLFLTAEIFFVNRIPFYISLRRKTDFIGVSHLKGRTAAIIYNAFKAIFRFYLQRGLCVQTVYADGKFGALKYLIQNMPVGPRVNLTSANKHVPGIEQRIRIVNERRRTFCHSLTFNQIAKMMTIHATLNIGKMLNYFPIKKVISSELSPCSILERESLDYKKHLTLQL